MEWFKDTGFGTQIYTHKCKKHDYDPSCDDCNGGRYELVLVVLLYKLIPYLPALSYIIYHKYFNRR